MSFQFVNEEGDEADIFKWETDEDKTPSRKEVIILGGKLLCSEIYSLMTKSPEVQTDMNKFTDAVKDENRG